MAWLREHAFAADLILAVSFTVVSVVFHFGGFENGDADITSPAWWTVPLVVAAVFPILWRRTRPISATIAVVAAQIICSFADINGPEFVGVLIALYSVGAHAAGRRRTQTLAAVTLMVGALFIAGFAVDELEIGGLISSVVFLVTAFVLGDNLRRRRETAQSLADRLERAERERELLAHQHVTAERTRIARELHDVVAHSVSVMVIQAGAARRNLSTSPATAEEALENIEQTGRATMSELRALLGVLRRTVEPPAEQQTTTATQATLDPQPTLESIQHLVTHSSDLPVKLTVRGNLEGLTTGVDLTGYRIVQESLTNVRRHGGPVTSVNVLIERHFDHVEVSVTDDGRGAAADDSGPGYGIIGMQERVDAMGGSLSASSHAGGGWQVRASLPAPPSTTRSTATPASEHAEATS